MLSGVDVEITMGFLREDVRDCLRSSREASGSGPFRFLANECLVAGLAFQLSTTCSPQKQALFRMGGS